MEALEARRAELNNIRRKYGLNTTHKNTFDLGTDSSHITPKDITSALKLEDINGFDDSDFKLQNIGQSNFPRNTPCFIVGTKGSGKTYLLASIAQYAYKTKQFKRIFYIYAENVDSTINRAIPREHLFQIPHDVATIFIIKYLSKKTKFCSCKRLIDSIQGYKSIPRCSASPLPAEVNILSTLPIYWDNYLNDLIKRKHIETTQALIQYANKTISKYSDKETVLTVEGLEFNVGRMTLNDFDMFIIDDIAQFADLFGTNRRNAQLYKYFTITRQNMTTFYLAGQELQQLPKMYRSQLGALVVLKGVDVIDSLRESKLPKLNVLEVYKRFNTLKPHEGVLVNYNTGNIEFIKV